MIPEAYPRKLPKAILFDWDNTLVDTWRVAYDSINFARTSLGLTTITIEDFWQRPHHSMRDAALDLFGEHFQEGEKIFYESVEKLHLIELITLQGAEDLLIALKARDIFMGVVSNKEGSYLRKEVEYLGWKPHFHKVIGARDTEADKPSHLPVLAALHESPVAPGHDVWFVGDSIVDVHCARASGCIPVVVGHGEASQQHDIIHAKDCQGLAQLIKNL
ncbi:MAG TPA: HAD family hydrolase [Alphaproteobacteria bacterium]|nr:HAD family hydrolase [Alphaproteobacteria bacterium]